MLRISDISEINEAYSYVDGGTSGSETTISDIRTRPINKPKRFGSTTIDEAEPVRKKMKMKAPNVGM